MEWAVVVMKPDGQVYMVISRDFDEICYLFAEAVEKNWTVIKTRIIEQNTGVRVIKEELSPSSKVVMLNALA